MYTIIVVSGPKDGTIYPAICYYGKEPFITNNRQDANTYCQELEECFPEGKYKVMEICDV
jgi:hypothetical protein